MCTWHTESVSRIKFTWEIINNYISTEEQYRYSSLRYFPICSLSKQDQIDRRNLTASALFISSFDSLWERKALSKSAFVAHPHKKNVGWPSKNHRVQHLPKSSSASLLSSCCLPSPQCSQDCALPVMLSFLHIPFHSYSIDVSIANIKIRSSAMRNLHNNVLKLVCQLISWALREV